MKIGKSLVELAQEIQRQAEVKRDLIAPVGKLEADHIVGEGEGEVALTVHNGKNETLPMNQLAHGQVAEYTGIPLAYYKRMQQEAPNLLRQNINRWFADKPADRRMVRTLDGKVRAFLSDRYRPLENEELAEAILPELLDRQLLILSCEITERRLYIKAVDKSILQDIPTGAKLGEGHTRFDTLSPGIVISNSEVGYGRLSIHGSVFTGGCTNLMINESLISKAHLGGRAEVSDDVYALLTDKTKRLTDAAVWSQVKDTVTGVFDKARFAAVTKKLVEATDVRIQSADVVEVVERVGRKFQLGEGERKGVLTRLIEGGDLTKYGLHAAVTRHSADVEDYDRATELEKLGGDIIDLGPGEWKVLTADAA